MAMGAELDHRQADRRPPADGAEGIRAVHTKRPGRRAQAARHKTIANAAQKRRSRSRLFGAIIWNPEHGFMSISCRGIL